MIILFLYNLWEFLFKVKFNEVYKHLNAHFLIHYSQTTVVLIACSDQSWKQDLFKLLVTEIGKRQIA